MSKDAKDEVGASKGLSVEAQQNNSQQSIHKGSLQAKFAPRQSAIAESACYALPLLMNTTPDARPEGDESPEQSTSERPPARVIRSFVKRAGRTTSGQHKALTELGPQFVVPFETKCLNFESLFGRAGPVVLEIGFGMGEATAQIAKTLPAVNFLACEVHEPGVGALLKRIGEQEITNIRIISHDAVEVLKHMIPPGSLSGFHLFFPDPWHKKRHHKRRLIQPEFVRQLMPYFGAGAYMHCATDWEPYAQQMLEVLSAEPQLKNTAEGFAEKPHYRPLTKFENRGLRLGHGVWDLVFIKP